MKIIAVLLPIYAAAFAPTASRGRITTHMKGAPHDVEANVGAGWAGMIKNVKLSWCDINTGYETRLPTF